MAPGDVEDQVTWVNGDGSICTRTIEVHAGRVVLNETHCEMPGQTRARRLQLDPLDPQLDLLAKQLDPLGRLAPPFVDPTAEMWTIGGTFLRRFVSVFDFEQKRMGFATITREEEEDFLDKVTVITQAREDPPPPEPRPEVAWWAPVLSLVPVGFISYFAVRKTRRQPTLEEGYGPLLVSD